MAKVPEKLFTFVAVGKDADNIFAAGDDYREVSAQTEDEVRDMQREFHEESPRVGIYKLVAVVSASVTTKVVPV